MAVSLSSSARWSLSTSLVTTLITRDLARWSSPLVVSSTADTDTWNSERPGPGASPGASELTAALLRDTDSPASPLPPEPPLLSSGNENSVKLCPRLFHRKTKQTRERKFFIREQNQRLELSGKLDIEHFYQKEPILIEFLIDSQSILKFCPVQINEMKSIYVSNLEVDQSKYSNSNIETVGLTCSVLQLYIEH